MLFNSAVGDEVAGAGGGGGGKSYFDLEQLGPPLPGDEDVIWVGGVPGDAIQAVDTRLAKCPRVRLNQSVEV